MSDANNISDAIAIIGMAGQFPDAPSVDRLWQNLCQGKSGLRPLRPEEIEQARAQGVDTDSPNFVSVTGSLDDADMFDADFFGYSEREAQVMDPQHRIFLHNAWHALEHASVDPSRFDGVIGVAAGGTMSRYIQHCLGREDICDAVGFESIGIGNNLDFLATTVSYKLNLNGPSFGIQSACSTSLVAVHSACQTLLNGEADLMIAGAVSVTVPQTTGYQYNQGGILSPDGVCRPFDEKANGTVFADGVGVVILQRLEDALEQGQRILAVVKGSAVNNDGNRKVGFTAPSVDGQSEVILETLAVADVPAESIGLFEAHGTGTRMGDPIEIKAVSNAYRNSTDKVGYCALSSVKGNLGHLDAAAGMAGLIKSILCLRHKMLVPHLHAQTPNSDLALASSPFYVNHQLTHWESTAYPRRAAVSSMGIGGTNAHVILEEWPETVECEPPHKSRSQRPLLLPLSATDPQALQQLSSNLAAHLRQHNLGGQDVSFTLAVGRQALAYRVCLVLAPDAKGDNLNELFRALEEVKSEDITQKVEHTSWLFADQPADTTSCIEYLYKSEPIFSQTMDNCADLLDMSDIGGSALIEMYKDDLSPWQQHQIVSFIVQLSLATLWKSWGMQPTQFVAQGWGLLAAICLAAPAHSDQIIAGLKGLLLGEKLEAKDIADAYSPVLANLTPDLTIVNYLGQAWDSQELGLSAFWASLLNPDEQTPGKVEVLPSTKKATLLLPLGSLEFGRLNDNLILPDAVSGQGLTSDNRPYALCGVAWSRGAELNWQAYFDSASNRLLDLPGYPFQSKSYWIAPHRQDESGGGDKKRLHSTKDWFYQHAWHSQSLPSLLRQNIKAEQGASIWFVERGSAFEQLAFTYASLQTETIVVYPDEEFNQVSSAEFSCRPCDKEDMQQMFCAVAAEKQAVGEVIYCWHLPVEGQSIDTQQSLSKHYPAFMSALAMLQALSEASSNTVKVWFLTSNAYRVLGDESIQPTHSLLNGFIRVVTQESGRLICRQLDLPSSSDGGVKKYEQKIIQELQADSDNPVVALRSTKRWVFSADPLVVNSQAKAALKASGVYLVTGGLGRLGFAAAKYLSEHGTVVLTTRQDPAVYEGAGEAGDAVLAERLDQLKALRRSGADINVLQADCSDQKSMSAMLQQVTQEYGQISGVIHAAGIIGEQTHLSYLESDTVHVEHMFKAKVHGTNSLVASLGSYQPDFVLLVSSLSPLLGGLGLTVYGAANSYMDRLAECLNAEGHTRWVSVNWEGWSRQGTSVVSNHSLGKEFVELSLDDEDIHLCLDIILSASELSNIIVSTGDLSQRMALWSTVSGAKSVTGHSVVSNVMVEQSSPAEIILDIACQLLGVNDLGVNENLFERGANSLTAIQLIARIRDIFSVDLPMQSLFDEPTVASLAASISPQNSEDAGDEELLSILADIENMDSDIDEIDALSQKELVGQENWQEL